MSELREKVADTLRDVAAKIHVDSKGETDPDPLWFSYQYADAVIAIVIEECAEVADQDGSYVLAKQIRALKEPIDLPALPKELKP